LAQATKSPSVFTDAGTIGPTPKPQVALQIGETASASLSAL